MHATDFWATDARKVWGKSWMHVSYIPDARNPFNLFGHNLIAPRMPSKLKDFIGILPVLGPN